MRGGEANGEVDRLCWGTQNLCCGSISSSAKVLCLVGIHEVSPFTKKTCASSSCICMQAIRTS